MNDLVTGPRYVNRMGKSTNIAYKLRRLSISSIIAVPLRAVGQTKGVLCIDGVGHSGFDDSSDAKVAALAATFMTRAILAREAQT